MCPFVVVNVYNTDGKTLADQRRRLLAGAEQVDQFVRDASETNDPMNEKVGRRLQDLIKAIPLRLLPSSMPGAKHFHHMLH